MRRVLGTVLALLAAVTAAPATAAAPAKGEVVIVANGPAYGDVTVPAKVTLDLDHAKIQTRSPYVVLAAGPSEGVTAFLAKVPGSDWPMVKESPHLARGRSRVRLLAQGATTIRVPATGIRGSLTVRLTRRLDATAKVTHPAPVGNTLVSEIPFTVGTPAVVVHGYNSRGSASVGRQDWLCLGDERPTCLTDHPDEWGQTLGFPDGYSESYWWYYDQPGPVRSKLSFADAGVTGSVTHYVLAFPLD